MSNGKEHEHDMKSMPSSDVREPQAHQKSIKQHGSSSTRERSDNWDAVLNLFLCQHNVEGEDIWRRRLRDVVMKQSRLIEQGVEVDIFLYRDDLLAANKSPQSEPKRKRTC